MHISWLALAQDISISAKLNPRQASVGQQLRLEVIVEGKANLRNSPELPPLSDFQVYEGGKSSNFSFINGQVSSSLKFTYILVPRKKGKFTIGAVKITHKGKVYTTDAITVDIVGASSGATAPNSTRPRAATSAPRSQYQGRIKAPDKVSDKADQAVFITTTVNKREVYVNEPLTLTFRFYSRIPILSQPHYQPPDTSGFCSEDLPPQKEYVTQIRGHEYKVIEINTALFPTTSGKLNISPANLVVQVQDFRRRSRDPFFDDFFDNFFASGQQVTLQSKPIQITVKEIPIKDRPSNFSGTVGKWSLSAKLDRNQAKVGEAVTLEMRIFGTGNVKYVGRPEIPKLNGFKVYETVSSSEVQKQGGEVKGVKIYKTLLRPEVTGKLTIPAIKYSYFDPKLKKFQKIQVPSFSLQVLPGEEKKSTSLPMFTGEKNVITNNQGVKVVAEDIRYLKTKVPLKPSTYYDPFPIWFWLLGFLLPPLFLGIVVWWQRYQYQLAINPKYARKITADRSAKQALRNAHKARLSKDTKEFYAALSQALMGYLADSLGTSRSGITQREIIKKLRKLGAEEKVVEQLSNLFDECDYARFAPSEKDVAQMKQCEDLGE